MRAHQRPQLRLIDCRALPKPVNQQTVSVLRVLLAKAQAGEVSDIACIYEGLQEGGTVLTGAFQDEPERMVREALRGSAMRLRSEDA